MDYFGLHKLTFAKAAGTWKLDNETGEMKAHFQTILLSQVMNGLKKEEVATREELKELQVHVYETLRELACVNDDYELGDDLTPEERDRHEAYYENYSRMQEILNDTLSDKTATLEC